MSADWTVPAVSGEVLLSRRNRGLCVRCGTRPAMFHALICQPCERSEKAEKKRQQQARGTRR